MRSFFRLLASAVAASLLSVQAFAAGANPTTGDNSVVGPMLIVGGVALVAILAFFLTGKKKK